MVFESILITVEVELMQLTCFSPIMLHQR